MQLSCNILGLVNGFYNITANHILHYKAYLSYLKIQYLFYNLEQKIIQKFYIHPFSQKVSSFFYIMELNLSAITLPIAVLNIDSIGSNIVEVLPIMTLLGYFSLVVYIQKRDREFVLSSAKDIKG